MHRLQPLQGFEVEPVVAHHQVAAFDQRQAQKARQVGVLEIGFVVGAGREQHDAAVALAGLDRAHGLEVVGQRLVGGDQFLHLHFPERFGKQARDGQSVFQQVAQARGRLRALRDHRPAPVRTVGDVKSGNVQISAAGWLHAVHAAQIAGVGMDQRAGQQAFGQQFLRAVNVGHHPVEQAGALADADLDLAPVLRRNQHREQVQRPRALRAVGVGIDVVGDAVVADFALQGGRLVLEAVKTVLAQKVEKAVPGGGQRLAGLAGAGLNLAGRGVGQRACLAQQGWGWR